MTEIDNRKTIEKVDEFFEIKSNQIKRNNTFSEQRIRESRHI